MSDSARLVVAILAAGGSRRLGRPKQLELIGGEPLIRRQARIAIEADIGPVVVVIGCAADACSTVVSDLPVQTVVNGAWAEGLSTSLRSAVAAARERRASALLILLCDQFGIEPSDVQALATAWREAGQTRPVAVRHASDAAGPPAILPASTFDELDRLTGDVGARRVLASFPEPVLIDLPSAIADLDTPADLVQIRQR